LYAGLLAPPGVLVSPSTIELAPFKQEADVVRDVGAGAIRDEHRDLVARAVVFIQLPIQ